MAKIREYLDVDGNSPYTKWFDRLNAAAAKVATAIYRMKRQDTDIMAAKGYWLDYKRRKRQG